MTALIKALEAVDGDVADQSKLQAALAKTTLSGDEAPWGDVKLDDNRQAISNVFLKKIVDDTTGDGVPDVQTFAQRPGRRPDVRRRRSPPDTPAPDRDNPECETGERPAVGRQGRDGELRAGSGIANGGSQRQSHRARATDPPLAGDRPPLRRRPRRARRRPRRAARRAPGRPRAQRGRQDDAVQPDLRGVPAEQRARRAVRARRDAPARRASAPAWGSRGRSRRRGCSLGSPVEDNLYLAVLGVARGPPADGAVRARTTAPCARRRGRWPRTVGLAERLGDLVVDLSHGEQRQLEVGMALAGRPQAADARRARRRALARRARAAHRAAARARPRRSR